MTMLVPVGNNTTKQKFRDDEVTGEVIGPFLVHRESAEILASFRECKRLAEEGEPHTPESLAEFNSLRAAEMARAEAKRQQPHPQTDLPLEAA